MDITQVYDLDDLKKLQENGASAAEVREAYVMMEANKERRAKATEKLLTLDWKKVSLEEVKDLLSQGADVKGKDKNGNTPADLARKEGHTDVATFLKEMEELSAKRTTKAKEIRSVDADRSGQPVDHSLRRVLFGGDRLRQNAPLSLIVVERLKERQSRS